MAFSLFKHAILMLWNNLGQAARVSLLPFVIMIVLCGGIVVLAFGGTSIGDFVSDAMPMDPFAGDAEISQIVPAEDADFGLGESVLAFAGVVIAAICAAFIFSWIAVSWHRFILLEEYTRGWLPQWHAAEIKLYSWRLFMLCLAFIGVAFIALLILGLASMGGVFAAIVFMIVATVGFSWMFYRWSLTLPAAALGQHRSLSECWNDTAPHSGMILRLVFVFVLFSVVIGILQAVVESVPYLGWMLSLAISWFNTLLGFSILTTLYGVIVQERPIDD